MSKKIIEFIKEYKILIILMISSILFGMFFLKLCLENLKLIIIFALVFGFGSEIYFLDIMIASLKDKKYKWSVVVDFNYYHEGIFELIFFTIILGIEFLAIIIAFIMII